MKKKCWILGMVLMLAVILAATMIWVDRSEIVVFAEAENGETVVLAHVHSEEGGACYHHHSGDAASGGGCYTVPVLCGGSITAKTGETYCGTWNSWYGPGEYYEGDKWWATCSSCGAMIGPHDSEITGNHMRTETYYSCDRCGTRHDGDGTCTKVERYDAGCSMDEQVIDCEYTSCGSYYITCNDVTIGLESTTLTADVTSQEAGVSVTSYQWSTGETSQTITVTQNGTYSCEITYNDQKSGAVSTAGASYAVANLDNTPPEVTLSYTPSAPTNTGTTIHIDATDNVGVTGYSFDGVTFSQEQDVYITKNGSYTAYATDAAGNIGSSVITVDNIDYEVPKIVSVKKSTESQYINGAIRVRVSAQDVVSEGYAREISVNYSTDGYNWSDSGEFSLMLDGTQEIFVRDAAGNISTAPVTIYQDTTPPSISGTQMPQHWTKDVVCLTVTASDDQSGIPEWAYQWGDGDWNPASLFNVTANGDYPVTVRDAAGNTASYTFHVTQIDKVAPAVSARLATEDWYDGSNTIYIQASDQESGLAELAYSYDGGATWTANTGYEISTSGDYLILVRDVVGNITESRIHAEKTTVMPDSNEPTEPIEEDWELQWHKNDLTGVPTAPEPTSQVSVLQPAQPTSQMEPDVNPEVYHKPKIILSISVPIPRASSPISETELGTLDTQLAPRTALEDPWLKILAAVLCGFCLLTLFFLWLNSRSRKAVLYQERADGKYHLVDRIKVESISGGKGYAVKIADRQSAKQITESLDGKKGNYMLKFSKHFAKKHGSEKLVIELCNGRKIYTKVEREVTL
ncbi:MAG: hypothetical protein HDR21_13345 [Lachnospiraceae bacterium]|nr:hypothetical protein [Lachnospiraceae bacterium]